METVGTITVIGEIVPEKVACPYGCGVDVNTKTGKCNKCNKVFKIHTAMVETVVS